MAIADRLLVSLVNAIQKLTVQFHPFIYKHIQFNTYRKTMTTQNYLQQDIGLSVDQVPNCLVNGAYSPVPPFPLFKIGQEKKESNKLSIQEKRKEKRE